MLVVVMLQGDWAMLGFEMTAGGLHSSAFVSRRFILFNTREIIITFKHKRQFCLLQLFKRSISSS